MKGISFGKGGSKTPASVMGSQGTSASIPVNHFKNKPTGKMSHPAGQKSSKAVSKPFNHASGDC